MTVADRGAMSSRQRSHRAVCNRMAARRVPAWAPAGGGVGGTDRTRHRIEAVIATRSPKLFLVAALVLVGSYPLLPAGSPWYTLAWKILLGYGCGAAVLLGARRLARPDRLPWRWIALGLFGNTTGIVVWVCSAAFLGDLGRPSPGEPFLLVLYPACATGLWLMARQRETRRNWAGLVDSGIIGTGLALLAWVYAIQPASYADQLSLLGRAVQIAYPIGDLVLLVLAIRLLRGGAGGAAIWWVTAAMVLLLAGDDGWVIVGKMDGALDTVPWVIRSLNVTHLLAFLCFGIAARHAGTPRPGPAGVPATPRLHPLMLATLVAAALIAPTVLAVQVQAGRVVNGMAIVVGSAVLSVLVMTRMALLLRQVERQARQVRTLSLRDELTGLPNRRDWNDELPRALELAGRTGRPVSVALLDLDRFKQFNDEHGHPAGDRLLKSAAAAWHGALRRSDTLARYGGEEFTVLLPEAGLAESMATIERVLAVTPFGQTFSAGVATWDGEESGDDLIDRADRALYAAKAAGRSLVLASESPSADV
jgi:diguanylate cyclase (GGDEF)-like protein